MGEESSVEAKYRALRRGLRSRRRDDPALDLFRRIETNLEDIGFVDRTLLELSRCYNPITNAPIVSLATRRAIVESLRAGRSAAAKVLLDECLVRYAPPAEKPNATPPDPGELPLPGQSG
jgi:hypothetical protein